MVKAARALFAVLGAEVDVERLFYGGRDLLGIRRYALKGYIIRVLTILKAFFERKLAEGKAVLPEVCVIPYPWHYYFLIGMIFTVTPKVWASQATREGLRPNISRVL
jgi:hypothetical protein